MDTATNVKTNWPTAKIIFNNSKIPCIFTEHVIDFKEKAELFDFFFANHCSIIKNPS